MKRIVAYAAVLAALALSAVRPSGSDAREDKADEKAGKNHTVEMLDNKFKPDKLTVAAGDTVTWVNKGKETHTATSDDKGKTFDTGDVEAGKKSKAIAFKKAGTVKYVCSHHDDMKGTVTVKAAKKDD